MATKLLTYDREVTGVSGFTGEPLPREVTDQSPIMYRLFSGIQATEFARGAFGEEYATQIETALQAIQEGTAGTAQ